MPASESAYETCKKQSIQKTMKLYERGALIIRKKKITNPKQALAIALQGASANCEKKIKRTDISNMVEKVNAIKSTTDLRYSDLQRLLFLIQDSRETRKYKKMAEYQDKLLTYLIHHHPQSRERTLLKSKINKNKNKK